MKAEKDLKDLAQSYPGIDLSQAEHFLSRNIDARTILAQKTVYEDLMKGEVVQARDVSLDDHGQPRHFFGFMHFQLNRQGDTTKPVLKISSTGSALDIKRDEQTKAQSLTAKPGYTEEIQEALSKATGSNAAEHTEEIKEISGIMSQPIAPTAKAIELKTSLAHIADWYFESDAQKRRDFLDKTESLFTLSYKQKILVKSPQGGTDRVLLQEHQVPLSELPTNHKGVPISERQVKKLLGGHSITVIAEPGTEAEGMPEAKVKFNPISGKLMEIGEGETRLVQAEQPKKNLEVPSMRHQI